VSLLIPMRRRGRWSSVLALVALALAGACTGGDSPSTPSAPSTAAAGGDVSGSWRGTAEDNTGPGQLAFQITQSNTTVSGTVTMTDTGTKTTGRGTLTGTVSGATIQLSIAIPAGGFDAPYASCSTSVSGTAQVASPSMTGTYSGTSSCFGNVTNGTFTLKKE
jgi:hypothetical protein